MKKIYEKNIYQEYQIDYIKHEDNFFEIKGSSADEDGLYEILIKIKTFHKKDCCEKVWADFQNTPKKDDIMVIENFMIKIVENAGFMVYLGYGTLNRFFVPCYNEQNGYYSDKLQMTIKIVEKTKYLGEEQTIEKNVFNLDNLPKISLVD
jgi:hypothetical protein